MPRWKSQDTWDDDDSSDSHDFDDDWTSSDGDPYGDSSEPTIECPACGEEIYEEAIRCPSCGEYLIDAQQQKSPRSRWVTITSIVCLVLIILSIFYCWF